MKIIAVDNFAREYVADELICENVANAYIGNRIVELLNAGQENSENFYKLVDDDHRLWRGMGELV